MAKGIGGGAMRKFSTSSTRTMNQAQAQAQDLELLIKELEGIKAKQKAMEQQEALCKANIQEALEAMGETGWTTSKGSVRLESRVMKSYGPEVKEAEAAYKRLKALADDLGDYEQKPGKTSVVFNFAKKQEEEAF